MATYPQEFGQELTKDYLDSLLRPIEETGRQNVGLARQEALSRGLEGQAMEGSLVGAAREGTAASRAGTISDFNYRLAGLGREERLTKEGQAFTEKGWAWQAAEAEKDRTFRERLASMGYDQAAADRKAQMWGAAIGAVGQAGGAIAGGALGRYKTQTA